MIAAARTILCNQCQRHILFHEYQSHLLMHGLLLRLTPNDMPRQNQENHSIAAIKSTNISNCNHSFRLESIIKQEPFSFINHNTSCDQNDGQCKNENKSSKFDSHKLESLCLDELLAKCMTFEPNLKWNINWCRYCSARASVSFHHSPIGAICSIHYRMWKEKKLDLSMYQEPTNIKYAINKLQCTEREYLISILTKIDMNAAVPSAVNRRSSLRKKQIKIEKVFDFSSESESESQSDSHSQSWNGSSSQYSSSLSSDSSEYESSEYDSSDFMPPKKEKQTIIKLENDNSSNIKLESCSSSNSKLIQTKSIKISKKPKVKRERIFERFECKDCGKIFESATIYKSHCLKKHGNNRAFGCKQCDKKYLDQRNLDIHIRKIHNREINHICKQCKRPFFDKREWRRHSQKCVATYWLIACPICDDAHFQAHTQWRQRILFLYFVDINAACFVYADMKKVHGIKQPYVCHQCVDKDVRYANKAGLDQHIERDHKMVRNFKCSLCPKSFHRKAVLEQHQVIHF